MVAANSPSGADRRRRGRLGRRCITTAEGFQQAFGERFDQRIGAVTWFDVGEQRGAGRFPCAEQRRHRLVEGGEFDMTEDGGLDLAGFDPGLAVAGAICGSEQCAAHAGKHLPVRGQAVDVGVGDAALQMRLDVLHVFRGGRVDVARQIEVEAVGLDLGQRRQARIPGDFQLAGEGVDDLVDVLRPQAVLVAVVDEATASIDHKNAAVAKSAPSRAFLVQHQNAGGDAGAVEQVGGQADDALDETLLDDAGANSRFGPAPE